MRGDRHSTWFPQALLGFLLLGAAAGNRTQAGGWFAYAPLGGGGAPLPLNGSYGYVEYAPQSRWEWGTAWQIIVAVAFLGTLAWYAVRAHRSGTPIRPTRLLAVLAAGAAMMVLSTGAAALARATDGQFLTTALGLPLALIGSAAGVWAGFRPGPGQRFAIGACLVCLTLAAYTLGASLRDPVVDPVTAALGLAVLAWWTRTVVPVIVAVAFLAAALAFNGDPLDLLAPGAVLLAGAIAALVVSRRPAPQGRA